MTTDLQMNMPIDKRDVRGAEALVALGYPAVEPILAQLLEWVQDGNWPVARTLAPFLSTIGSPLAPHVAQILQGDDDTWKYFLLSTVVGKSKELTAVLLPQLERLKSNPTEGEVEEGLDLMASNILTTARRCIGAGRGA
jgi:hypothetical protein